MSAPVPRSHPLRPAPAGVPGAALRMVLYFDVFQHPLSTAEVERLVAPGRPDEVRSGLDSLAKQGLVERRDRFWVRSGMLGGIQRRLIRSRHAERLWPAARQAAGLLRRLPYVRGLLVTGSLSKNATAPGADVDFLVLVEPGRVWTLKTVLQGLRRGLPEPVRELFCTNYLLATDDLVIDDKNLFTAVELATAMPVWGRDECLALYAANRWAWRYVPGMDWSEERAARLSPGGRPSSRGPGRLGAAVERAALDGWSRYWNRKYDWLDDDTRAQRFKRRRGVATNHLHDFQHYVIREVAFRYRSLGLQPEPLWAEAASESPRGSPRP